MSEPMHLGLDNPAISGRLRVPQGGPFTRYEQRPSKRYFDEQVRKNSSRKPPIDKPSPIWAQPLSGQASKVQASERPSAQTAHDYSSKPPAAESGISQAVDPVGTLAGAPHAAWVRPEPFDFSRSASRRAEVRRMFSNLKAHAVYLLRYLLYIIARLDPRQLRDLPQAVKEGRYSRLQVALTGMAVVVFVTGLMVSFQSAQTNHRNAAKVAALSKDSENQGGNGGGSVPSTTKPSASAYRSYAVAPDLPRYIRIPKLGVNTRVLQVGIKSDGSLGTPGNVYDAAWYTGSAKPGQPGAMLIDGHVSSWTTHGVFYGLRNLAAGDIITIQRGDGQIFTYKVVRSQTYPDGNVDMQAAITPVTSGKPGLNLITCTGRVKPGTSEFDQRIIVFAEQI